MIPHLATHVPRLAGRFFPDLLWRVPTGRRVAYLTFDDGPLQSMTPRLLDVLARFEAKATFFLVGLNAKLHPGLVRELQAAGHAVGNHTYTHPDAWRTAPARLVDELNRTTTLLEDQLQQPVRLMRPPYGRFTRAMRDWCQVRRQQLTMWDVMPGDYLPGATQAGIEAHVLAHVRPGSIIVLHDNPKALAITPPALETMLSTLTAGGWRFEAL